MILWY